MPSWWNGYHGWLRTNYWGFESLRGRPEPERNFRFGAGQNRTCSGSARPESSTKKFNMFYVYYLSSQKNKDQHYVGYTENLKLRLEQHNKGLSASTKPYRPWELIFYEAYKNKRDAKRRELYLKTTKGRKALKLMLQDSLRHHGPRNNLWRPRYSGGQ